jgi:hypothetical protein
VSTVVTWTPPNGTAVTLWTDGVGTLPQSGAKLLLQQHEGTAWTPPAVQWATRLIQPGATFLRARHQQRVIVFHVLLVATTWTQHVQALNELGTLLSPAQGLGTLSWTRPDNVTKLLTGVWTDMQAQVGVESLLATPLALTFTSADPYWRATTPTTLSIGGVGQGWTFPQPFPLTFQTTQPVVGMPFTLTNPGTAPAAPVIALDGPMTNPRVDHLTTGRYIAVLGTVPAGGTFTIDMRPESSGWGMSAYGTTYQSYPPLDPQSQMFDLLPGPNVLLITNAGPGAGGTGTITFTTRDVAL